MINSMDIVIIEADREGRLPRMVTKTKVVPTADRIRLTDTFVVEGNGDELVGLKDGRH